MRTGAHVSVAAAAGGVARGGRAVAGLGAIVDMHRFIVTAIVALVGTRTLVVTAMIALVAVSVAIIVAVRSLASSWRR
jgi:hypothetical protein